MVSSNWDLVGTWGLETSVGELRGRMAVWKKRLAGPKTVLAQMEAATRPGMGV